MIIWELLVLAFLMLLNGFFAMSEMAVISSRRARLVQLADERLPGADTALALLDDPTRFISTVQICLTLISILAGAFGGATLVDPLAGQLSRITILASYAHELATALVVIGLTYVTLIAGELAPKRLGMGNAERIAARVAPVMTLLSRLAGPLVWLMQRSTQAMFLLLHLRFETPAGVTEEEVKTLIAEGTQRGVFEPAEREMIEGVLRLTDRSVRAIMTPRLDVVWLDINDSPGDIIAELRASGYSRFPVSRGDIDEIEGIVQAKDLLNRALAGEPFDMQCCIKKPLFVHDSTGVMHLLELLRQSSVQIAVVVDEYGSLEGIVTLTDILESIAGELPDEDDGAPDPEIVRREDGSFLIDGMVPVDEVEALLGLKNMRGDRDFHTIGGFVLSECGHIPKPGEHFIWHGVRFEVVDMDNRRIDKIAIMPEGVEIALKEQ